MSINFDLIGQKRNPLSYILVLKMGICYFLVKYKTNGKLTEFKQYDEKSDISASIYQNEKRIIEKATAFTFVQNSF